MAKRQEAEVSYSLDRLRFSVQLAKMRADKAAAKYGYGKENRRSRVMRQVELQTLLRSAFEILERQRAMVAWNASMAFAGSPTNASAFKKGERGPGIRKFRTVANAVLLACRHVHYQRIMLLILEERMAAKTVQVEYLQILSEVADSEHNPGHNPETPDTSQL